MHAAAKKRGQETFREVSRSNAARIQSRKLVVGPPNNTYEKEADALADRVSEPSGKLTGSGPLLTDVRPAPRISRLSDIQGQRQAEEKEEEVQTRLQRQPEEEEEEVQANIQRQPEEENQEEEEPVQTKRLVRTNVRDKEEYPEPDRIENRLFEKKGKGEILEDQTRTSMEVVLGADFRTVNIHRDADAAAMNRELKSQAFTHGKDIFFGSGKYAPDTPRGKHLIAHELTHVVQQGTAAQHPFRETIEKNRPQTPQPDHGDRQALKAEPPAGKKVEDSGNNSDTRPAPEDQTPVKAFPGKDKGPETDKKRDTKGETAQEKGPAGQGIISRHLKKVSQPEFESKKEKIGRLSANEKKKEVPETKLEQAQKAIVPPAREAASRSEASQVKAVESMSPPQPKEGQAKQSLHQALETVVPATLDEVDKFKEGGKGQIVGAVVKNRVTQDTKSVRQTYQEIENTPEPKALGDLPEKLPGMETAPETPFIDTGEGVVGELLPEHGNLDGFHAESDELMEKEGIKEEELEMVDEGELAQAKARRKSIKERVSQGPAEVRQFEEQEKLTLKTSLKKEEQIEKQQMRVQRKNTLNQTGEDQKKTKTALERKRQKVTDQLNGIYQSARERVKTKLDALEKQALKAFERGEKEATKDFETNVEQRINRFKQGRYGRIGGSLLWAKDRLFGMDDLPEVKDIFIREKSRFVTRIEALIRAIFKENKKVIQECREIISDAQKRIQAVVADLGPELFKTGQAALKEMRTKLAALDRHINKRESALKQTLTRKRDAAVKAIEEKIEKIKEEMSGLVSKLGNFLRNAMVKFFKWALKKAGYASDTLMGIINQGKAVIRKIVTDPVGFLKNIVSAVKKGIGLFRKNIKKHLVGGLISWLTGALADVPIQLPGKFDLKGILSIVLQILGLTWNRIRKKLVKRLGEPMVRIAETSIGIVKRLITQGPMALWEMIKEKASAIKTRVMEGIRSWVITKVIKQGIIKLLSFLNPVGAIIQAILAIYNTIMFFVENWQRIVDFVKSVFSSIGNIAMGRLSAAAAYIEQSLGMTIPIIMNFLARLLGLSGIGKAVSKIIAKIRRPIDKIVEKVIDKVAKLAARLMKKGKTTADKIKDKVFGWLKIEKRFKDPGGKQHTLKFEGRSPKAPLIIKSRPKPVPDFIETARQTHKNNRKRLTKLDQIDAAYREIAQQQRMSQKHKPDIEKQKETGEKINELMKTINKQLPFVFESKEWGNRSNPLLIDWPKRASIKYDTLYFGPRTKRWISQERLKAAKQNDGEKKKIKADLTAKEKKAWSENNEKIEDYKPEQLEALPDGGAIIGLSSEWHVKKGKKFILKPGKTTGGSQLNKILKKYGFRPSKENEGKGLDADHVIEMQLGGKNLIRNLWPLAASENRSSGAFIKSMSLKNQKNNEDIPISRVKEEALKRPIWLKINALRVDS